MNLNMKQFLTAKFRVDKNDENVLASFGTIVEPMYMATKNRKDIQTELYKRMSTYSLLVTLQDNDKRCGDDLMTKEILLISTKATEELSKNSKEFDKKLSLNVIKHFQDVSEDNQLMTMKKTLANIKKEIKVREEKLHLIQEQIHQNTENFRKSTVEFSGINEKLQAAIQAEESSEKELELKKELQRQKSDLFLTKLFEQELEKVTMAEKMLEFFKAHLEYYQQCQRVLTMWIPEFQNCVDKCKQKFVFNQPLVEHIKSLGSGRKLSVVMETCIKAMDNLDTLHQEGLFRVSGSKSKVDLLKNAININYLEANLIKTMDASVYAGVLKQYLRELPEPLLTYGLYDQWSKVSDQLGSSGTAQPPPILGECLQQLPLPHYDNLVYLLQFLRKIHDLREHNKMPASNLGLVIGPNLIRPPPLQGPTGGDTAAAGICESPGPLTQETIDVSRNMIIGALGANIVEYLILHYHELFPDAPKYQTVASQLQNITVDKSNLVTAGVINPICEMDHSSSSSTSVNIQTPNMHNSPNHSRKPSIIDSELQSEHNNNNTEDTSKSADQNSSFNKFLRKAPAPPPPPTNTRPTDQADAAFSVRSEARAGPPQIKKRFSKLEPKSEDNPTLSLDAVDTANPPSQQSLHRSVTTTGAPPSRSALAPKPPMLKPRTPFAAPINEPPKRPVNPPPPIPKSNENANDFEPGHHYSKSDASINSNNDDNTDSNIKF